MRAGLLRQLFGTCCCFPACECTSLLADGLAQCAAGHQGSGSGGSKFRRASSACTVATVAPEPKVQEGDSSGPFRLSVHDGRAHRYHIKSPDLEIRLKEILAAIAYSRGCPNLISPSTSVHLRLPITGKCIFNPGIQFPESDTGRIAANCRP